MKDTILIYIILFFITLLVLYVSYYIYLIRKTLFPKGQQKVAIIGQRERIEDKIYDYQSIMLSDSDRLFDNTNLLLHCPVTELNIDRKIPNYSFFSNLGININNIQCTNKSVFCLIPFNKRFEKIYQTINSTCKQSGYTCLRSDIPFNPGNILRQIVKMMLESQLIIAVLDGKNSNVFYEIGIAHSIGKTVILIANLETTEDIPFDLKSNRLLLYSNLINLNKQLGEILNKIQNAK